MKRAKLAKRAENVRPARPVAIPPEHHWRTRLRLKAEFLQRLGAGEFVEDAKALGFKDDDKDAVALYEQSEDTIRPWNDDSDIQERIDAEPEPHFYVKGAPQVKRQRRGKLAAWRRKHLGEKELHEMTPDELQHLRRRNRRA